MIPLLSLTFLFGITTFVADELLEETLGLEAAPVEVMVTSRVLVVIYVSVEFNNINYLLVFIVIVPQPAFTTLRPIVDCRGTDQPGYKR